MEDQTVLALIKQLVRTMGSNAWNLFKDFLTSSYVRNFAALAVSSMALYSRINSWLRENNTSILEYLLKTSKLFLSVTKILSWFRKPKDPRPMVRTSWAAQRFPESIVQGSEETEMFHKRGEALVVDVNGNAVGKGARFWNVLVVPEHVIGTCRYSSGSSVVYICHPDRPDCKFELAGEPVFLYSDLLGYNVSSSTWSQLGISQVSIGWITKPTAASVVGVKRFGTSGILKVDDESFGSVRYMATTCHGYSGALYTSGNLTLGIHLNGGKKNLGIAADFVRALVSSKMDKTMESSDDDTWDFINQRWFDGGKLRDGVKVDYITADEIYASSQGRFHVVNKDVFRKHASEEQWNSLVYADREVESVFPLGAPRLSPGASNMSEKVTAPTRKVISGGTAELQQQLQRFAASPSGSRSKGAEKRYGWIRALTETELMDYWRLLKEDQENASQ
ncbi:hypothetical protein 1 [Hubei sobemo-like virus 42]|uniref:hypothetical protein 1 n=1 Tax=Hubei sobemo-like virus 42 TaxID=1923230 RepID=UPI00090C6E04|nr:hypothetical protein 1 [Hubei sobemo-like virus 42]APG75783.1 hypothetical protein 1 [Hubei sobemo-like virus 42]